MLRPADNVSCLMNESKMWWLEGLDYSWLKQINLAYNTLDIPISNENGCYKISHDLRDAGPDGAWNTSIFLWYHVFLWLKYWKIIDNKHFCSTASRFNSVICWKGKNHLQKKAATDRPP